MNAMVYCTFYSSQKETFDMVNLLDHHLSMSLLFRRPRKGVFHHIHGHYNRIVHTIHLQAHGYRIGVHV